MREDTPRDDDAGLPRLSRYEVLAALDLPASRLAQSYDPDRHPHLTPLQQMAVEQKWQELLRTGRRLTDGTLYRFLGFRHEGAGVRLSLGRTSYREYLCTNVAHPEWRDEYGPDCMADAVAVTGIAVTRDGQVPLQRRSALVGEWPGAYAAAPSGHPQPPATMQETLMEELTEETGARRDEVSGEPQLTGLVLETARHKVEVTFLLRLAITWDQLRARTPADAWEYQALAPLRWAPRECGAFLREKEQETLPQSHGALLLAGRLEFGRTWYERTAAALRKESMEGPIGG